MIRPVFIRNIGFLERIFIRHKSESALNIEQLEQDTTSLDVIDEEAKIREKELQQKRNKSRLRSYHRDVLHGKAPAVYARISPALEYQRTLKYTRQMYGRYGKQSGINPALCWPTKEELANKKEYEAVAFPYTIQEVVESAQKTAAEKKERIQQRQLEIANKVEQLEQWKQDLQNKIAKKEAEAYAAKERKERLVEEVRRHFGYTVDPKDDKFKEMLEKKEKEQRKAAKEAKNKAKDERMISHLLSKKSEESSTEAQAKHVDKGTTE